MKTTEKTNVTAAEAVSPKNPKAQPTEQELEQVVGGYSRRDPILPVTSIQITRYECTACGASFGENLSAAREHVNAMHGGDWNVIDSKP